MLKKKYVITSNVALLLWYALAMPGVPVGDRFLVAASFREDWMFLLIPIATFALFLCKGKIAKIPHLAWLSIWLVGQLLCHEWYTIFGKGWFGSVEGKIEYFSRCVKFVEVNNGVYYTDIYHTVLHILLLLALIASVCCYRKSC